MSTLNSLPVYIRTERWEYLLQVQQSIQHGRTQGFHFLGANEFDGWEIRLIKNLWQANSVLGREHLPETVLPACK